MLLITLLLIILQFKKPEMTKIRPNKIMKMSRIKLEKKKREIMNIMKLQNPENGILLKKNPLKLSKNLM
jgi:hypothetical protein